MTNNIYPPDHLLRKWESLILDEEQNVDVVLYEAFQAGADQELEACCEWIANGHSKQGVVLSNRIRAARRPKPPSLKAQALGALYAIATGADDTREFHQDLETIKQALESLPD
jgi:hypothetical protein